MYRYTPDLSRKKILSILVYLRSPDMVMISKVLGMATLPTLIGGRANSIGASEKKPPGAHYKHVEIRRQTRFPGGGGAPAPAC